MHYFGGGLGQGCEGISNAFDRDEMSAWLSPADHDVRYAPATAAAQLSAASSSLEQKVKALTTLKSGTNQPAAAGSCML